MKRYDSKIIVVIIWLILTIMPVGANARTIYVDDSAGGANDGTSWENAYIRLTNAIDVALEGDVILVAEGIYRPNLHRDPGLGDRSASFDLNAGVTIAGGYAGSGAQMPDDRDIILYRTILSGDLNGDDVKVDDPSEMLDEQSRAENCYHVVDCTQADESSVLDGVTVTGGNADGTGFGSTASMGAGILIYSAGPTLIDCTIINNAASELGNTGEGRGAGIYIEDGSPTLLNCVFTDNAAGIYGGGLYNHTGSPTLSNCTFTGNQALDAGGGMMNATGSGSPVLIDCTFGDNSAVESGGGIYNEHGSVTVSNCTFNNNDGGIYGGGISSAHQADGSVIDCVFTGNTSENGGAVCNRDQSSLTFESCVFDKNSGTVYGGGMYNDFESSPTVTDCVFSQNSGGDGGGGIVNLRGSSVMVIGGIFEKNLAIRGGGILSRQSENPTTLINCLFSGNSSDSRGAGICSNDAGVSMINCTYADNYTSDIVGGGIFCAESELAISNCILWGNFATGGILEPAQIYTEKSGSSFVNYSCIQGLTGTFGGIGNIGEDPLFADSTGGDYHLSEGSPCVNTGYNLPLPEWVKTDLDGNMRIRNGVVDMGAYEYGSTPLPLPESDYTGQISSSNDDGYAFREELQSLSNPMLKIGYSEYYLPPYYMAGMVFRNVDIPQGTKIISARLKVKSYMDDLTGLVYGRIRAGAADDTAGFGGNNRIDSLSGTESFIYWDIIDPWSQFTWYDSPDIAAVIQEVIDRDGWSAGNSIAILISTRFREGGFRSICSFDYGSDSAAQLEITYVP